MSKAKTICFALMDPPFEASRTTTALRAIDAALRLGVNVNVFAYEGAVMLPFRHQQPHSNPVHGRDTQEEDHPLPREWVAGLIRTASERGLNFEWVNCGMCVDERGAGDAIDGILRGAPADLWRLASASDNTLIVPTA
ncbi:MAG TPA: DsrE family protein [Sphingomicrobium sp.]|jgi:tRNA 2-thiouridine synthesizing protein D|nr:DsrE family protein [Sphingomicrobium sp.]